MPSTQFTPSSWSDEGVVREMLQQLSLLQMDVSSLGRAVQRVIRVKEFSHTRSLVFMRQLLDSFTLAVDSFQDVTQVSQTASYFASEYGTLFTSTSVSRVVRYFMSHRRYDLAMQLLSQLCLCLSMVVLQREFMLHFDSAFMDDLLSRMYLTMGDVYSLAVLSLREGRTALFDELFQHYSLDTGFDGGRFSFDLFESVYHDYELLRFLVSHGFELSQHRAFRLMRSASQLEDRRPHDLFASFVLHRKMLPRLESMRVAMEQFPESMRVDPVLRTILSGMCREFGRFALCDIRMCLRDPTQLHGVLREMRGLQA